METNNHNEPVNWKLALYLILKTFPQQVNYITNGHPSFVSEQHNKKDLNQSNLQNSHCQAV